MKPLRLGTRGSRLALVQAEAVRQAMETAHPGLHCEIVVLKTAGDTLREPGGVRIKGLFVKELEEALLTGQIDVAVHSAKDMESNLPAGLALAAVLKRADPRDALVAKQGITLAALAAGARVGAGSLRRQAQLARCRGDLTPTPIRGNVETRLKKLDSGEYDALILAACGLIRLGFADRISEPLEPDNFLPAPGQGALAIEICSDKREMAERVTPINDTTAYSELLAERACLKALGASCQTPVGALARFKEEQMTLEAEVLSPDGQTVIRQKAAGPARAAEKLGKGLASQLRAAGADRLLYQNN